MVGEHKSSLEFVTLLKGSLCLKPCPCLQKDEDYEFTLATDFEIGHFFRERIIPRAVLYFTGEALEDDESVSASASATSALSDFNSNPHFFSFSCTRESCLFFLPLHSLMKRSWRREMKR